MLGLSPSKGASIAFSARCMADVAGCPACLTAAVVVDLAWLLKLCSALSARAWVWLLPP
ncbi:hypothetical protein [Verrucomicrobium spinosum]|uniref:hypothetical protein n=1 Tax=Verrucomicrobium spinosum TaxID=2736 RepID=UPI0012E1AC44|nr:hypothetical protein [Verrucomicrobium spinosum]